MTIWMKVTQDKYELPVAIADTVQELTKICGITVNNIQSTISHYKSGKLKTIKFVKVELED